VAFASNRSGSYEIWACDRDGGDLIRLTSFGRTYGSGSPRWSPDGQYVAFDSRASGNAAIWVVGAEGGREPRQLSTGRNDVKPSWSHDGRWVYFGSIRSDGEQIWKVPAKGGEEVRVTKKQGGMVPFESADGKWVYYYASTKTPGIWKVSLETGEEAHVLDLQGDPRGWTLTDRGIYFLGPDAARDPIVQFFDFAAGTVKPVARLEKNAFNSVGGLAASPDGQWLLYTVDSRLSDVMLVENFR
jgi:dipeptidyl aminopeptidase/acylaminoacyl peptidase